MKKETQEYKERFNKAAAERTILTETGKKSESEIQQLKGQLKVVEDKYREIEKKILEEIKNGHYLPGETLESERILAKSMK